MDITTSEANTKLPTGRIDTTDPYIITHEIVADVPREFVTFTLNTTTTNHFRHLRWNITDQALLHIEAEEPDEDLLLGSWRSLSSVSREQLKDRLRALAYGTPSESGSMVDGIRGHEAEFLARYVHRNSHFYSDEGWVRALRVQEYIDLAGCNEHYGVLGHASGLVPFAMDLFEAEELFGLDDLYPTLKPPESLMLVTMTEMDPEPPRPDPALLKQETVQKPKPKPGGQGAPKPTGKPRQ